MSIVCPLPSCYLIIVSVAPAVSPSLPSFVSLYSLLVFAVLCWSVVLRHVSFMFDCAPVFCLPACLPACLFFPFGVVFVALLFHFIILNLISSALESSTSSLTWQNGSATKRTQQRGQPATMGPGRKILNVHQGDQTIEVYARDFVGVARQSATEEACLMVFFWGGLAEPFKSQMPYWHPKDSLEEYINLALSLSGSTFRMESVPKPAPPREPTESAPEPAPPREPTESAPEPAPPREPTESAPEPALPREPTESAPEPVPSREPTVRSRARSVPGAHGIRSRARSAPWADGVRSRARSAPWADGVHSRARSAPWADAVRSRVRSDPWAHGVRSDPWAHGVRSDPGAHAVRSVPGAHAVRSVPGAHGVRSRARSVPGAIRVRSRARSVPGADRVRFRARSVPGAHAVRSDPGPRSGLGTHRARSRASPTLAPLCAHCSRPCSTPRAWPTSLLDIFLFSVCGASGIRSLKGGLCHCPAGMPRLATRCLCVLSTWLVVCLVPCAPMSIVCPLPSCYLIIVSVAPAVSPSLPSFVSLYSLLVSAVLCWSVVLRHVSFMFDCAPVFCLPACLPACLFFPFGVVFVALLFHFIILNLISSALESSTSSLTWHWFKHQ